MSIKNALKWKSFQMVALVAILLCVSNSYGQVSVSVIKDEGTATVEDTSSTEVAQNSDEWDKLYNQYLPDSDRSDNFDLNALIVDFELYIWNRIADVLDIARVGLGVGFGIGAEVAVTDYMAIGFDYRHYAKGVDFPHCIPPLWLVDYYDKKPIFNIHETKQDYFTAAFGPCRYENINTEIEPNFIFPRRKWDIRVAVDALILNVNVTVGLDQVADLITGFVGFDLMGDDDHADQFATRKPADQFGRGVCNILFGIVEIPSNILRVTDVEGDLPGISKGVAVGIWRFLLREVVGVVELVTFPFGWTPIIEPEYVFQKEHGVTWKVNRPTFYKRYSK